MVKRTGGFTIVELLVVMAIILVLAGLVLGTSSYVHNKAARSRAEAEIAAMSAALENYKADNGVYPDAPATDARTDYDPASYQTSCLILYKALTGDADVNRQYPDGSAKSYFTFKDNQLAPATGNVLYIQDPFGASYGYSTINASTNDPAKGYNPTFDLWSTSGTTGGNATDSAKWVKNW